MTRTQIKIGASCLILLAAALYLTYALGAFTPPAGANNQATGTCPVCGTKVDMPMSEVIQKGGFDSGSGWTVPCPKNDARIPMRVITPAK